MVRCWRLAVAMLAHACPCALAELRKDDAGRSSRVIADGIVHEGFVAQFACSAHLWILLP